MLSFLSVVTSINDEPILHHTAQSLNWVPASAAVSADGWHVALCDSSVLIYPVYFLYLLMAAIARYSITWLPGPHLSGNMLLWMHSRGRREGGVRGCCYVSQFTIRVSSHTACQHYNRLNWVVFAVAGTCSNISMIYGPRHSSQAGHWDETKHNYQRTACLSSLHMYINKLLAYPGDVG